MESEVVCCPFNVGHRMPAHALTAHQRRCNDRIVSCQYDSSHLVKARELARHEESCSQEWNTCPYDRSHRMPNFALQKHKPLCLSRLIACPHSNCPEYVRARDVQNHASVCDYRIVSCPYNSGHRMAYLSLVSHLARCRFKPSISTDSETSESTLSSSDISDEDPPIPDPNTYKCRLCNDYQSNQFDAFVWHLAEEEQLDVSLQDTKTRSKLIRVYSRFFCSHCRTNFTSSAAACQVVQRDGCFTIEREYGMDCKLCGERATMLTPLEYFCNWAKYLAIRMKYFPAPLTLNSAEDTAKVLVGHIPALCELCKELGYNCVTGF
jgi:hypothetical protein